jgi:hypothetical protein
MTTVPAAGPAPQIDNDQDVPEELIGRLYGATENSVSDLLPDLTLQDRAYLAMFCYRKSHLHRVGLAIAASCGEHALVQTWGTALGQALYAQALEPAPAPSRGHGPHRSKITLASFNGNPFPAPDADEEDPDDVPAGITVALA